MSRLTSYKNGLEREMICRYEDCDTVEEYCPHLNEANCPCLQEVLNKLAEYEDLEEQGLLVKLPCKNESKTNSDRIRNMSDEELAKRIFLEFDVKDVCRFCIPTMRTEGKCDGRCKSGILQWLQAEVKEGNSN